MDFEQAYDSLMRSRSPLRPIEDGKDSPTPGLGHAERLFLQNVWWPAFRSFDDLFPEYPVNDYGDGQRYIDFAYLHPLFEIAIEIDGFGPHWREINTTEFCRHLTRQNHLVIDGWHVLRFGYADVRDQPRKCQQLIQQLIGRLNNDPGVALQQLNLLDRELVLLALRSQRPITSRDAAELLDCETQAATRHLKRLMDAGWLVPAGGSQRIRSYQVHPSHTNIRI